MQGSGDLFIIQLVCCIKKLYFFMNIGSEVSVRIQIFDLFFLPCLPPLMLETP